MKIIDVCENPSGAGCIKCYYENNGINDYQILFIWLSLVIGDITKNRLSFLQELYNDPGFDYHDQIKELLNSIDEDTMVRVWSSKGNADDYLLLLYICNLLKNKVSNMSVVYSTDYLEEVINITAADYKEIPLILKNEIILTSDMINKFANEWNELCTINSDLRVLENGKIINKKFSDYDAIILDKLEILGPCKIASLIGDLMANYTINDASDAVYLYLVDRLINQNKIKVITKGERHFIDIIEKN